MPTIPGSVQNVAVLHGLYFQQNYYGNMYHLATALAGVTLTTTGSTVQTFGVWNPAGNSKLLVPTKCRVGFVGATGTVTSLAWTFGTGLGSVVAGTSAVTARTNLSPVNANLGFGLSSVALGGVSFTLGTAPAIHRYFGASWGAPLATTAAIFPTMVDDFDGDTIIAPGTALFLSGVTAPGGAANVSLSWYEVPA